MTASTLEKFAQKLYDSPLCKKFKEDEKKAVLAERKGHVKGIKDDEKVLLDALPGHDKAIAEAQEKHDDCKLALEDAEKTWRLAYSERRNFVVRHDAKKTSHEVALRSSYDPAIDFFIRELRQLSEEAFDLVPHILEEEKVFNGGWRTTKSDLPEQQACRDAIGEAIEAAEGLKMMAVDDVTAELDKLRDGVRKSTAGFLDY